MDDSDSVGSAGSLPGHVVVERKVRKMRPAQFVHLSADYMRTDSLAAALQIMTFAEEKGYAGNILILLHTWCLLRAMDKEYEAEICFDRACALLATAERSYLDGRQAVFEGSDLEVYAVYLVCIFHIRRQGKQSYVKVNPNQKHCMADAMLIEAMYLRHGREPSLEDALQWVAADDTWLEAADAIRGTDYILLAEDAYWESFIRNPRQNYPLIQIIEIKNESKRLHTAPSFMLRALEVGRYNWYLRDYFSYLEGDERTDDVEDVLDQFYNEARAATKIQSVSRMRKHLMRFEIKKGELRARKKAYNALVRRTYEMGALTVKKNAHRLYRIWRENARELREHKLYYLKRLKKYIQNYMVWLRYYRSNTKRSKMALKYVSACQVNYDFTRLHYFHIWLQTLRAVELTRATETIKFTLRMQKREETLEYHLNTTTQIGFKRRAKLLRKSISHWKQRYETKVRKRATAIIRLVIRNVIRRFRMKQKKEKLEASAAAVKEMIYSNTYQLIKRRWSKWRKLYKRNRKMWAATTLATHIPLVWRRRKARLRIHDKRRCAEVHDAVKFRHLYLNKESVFHLWVFLRAKCRVERAIRLKIARIQVRRRAALIQSIHDKYHVATTNCRDRHWTRWKQYVVLWKETKEVSASIVTLWWKRIHNSLKAVKARKHMKGSRILATSIFKMQLRRGLKRINQSVVSIKKFVALNKMYARLRIYYLRVAMNLFKEFNAFHIRMRELVHIVSHKKLGRVFYPGVQLSVHVSPMVVVPILEDETGIITMQAGDRSRKDHAYIPFDKSRGGATPYMLSRKEAGCECGLQDTALPWEHYVKSRVFALPSIEKYELLKAFQVLMASYRIRVRRLRSLSFMLAESVSSHVLRQTSLRCASAHTLQRAWRYTASRMRFTAMAKKCRRLHEAMLIICALKPKRRKLFNQTKYITFTRMAARLRIQTWVRMKLHTNTLMRLKINFTRLVNLEALVHFRMKSNVTRIILRHMVFNYGVRSSQLMLNPADHPGPFKTTLLAESPLDLLPPVISRSKGSILKNSKDASAGQKLFSASMANLNWDSQGNVTEYGSMTSSVVSSRSLKANKSGSGKKGSVTVPGALKSFVSEVFHSHLFNVKRSNTVVLDNSKPMIQDDEISYLAGICDALFCQTGYVAGNNALKVVIKNFKGSKLVAFGGSIDTLVARDLCFFLSAPSPDDAELEKPRVLKIHLSAAPMKFEVVERFSRSLAASTCWLSELSVDISSLGVLGIVTVLSALRVNTSVKVMVVHFNQHLPSQWCIEKCFRYLAINKTLEGLYLYGMVLERDTCLGLLAAVTDGLPNLISLEFEYDEDEPEASNLFREVIVKRESAMKVAIHAPSSAS